MKHLSSLICNRMINFYSSHWWMLTVSIFQHGIAGDFFFLCYLVGLGEMLCRWSRPSSLMHLMLILKVNIYHPLWSKVTSIKLLVYCDSFVSCQLNPFHSFLVLFYLSVFCDSVVSWSLLQLWIFWDGSCSILCVFRPCPALWSTGTNTKVLSFCGKVPLTIIDEWNFFPGLKTRHLFQFFL